MEPDALGTVPKNRKKRLDGLETREKIETIQTTALLKSARLEEFAVPYTPVKDQLKLV